MTAEERLMVKRLLPKTVLVDGLRPIRGPIGDYKALLGR